jgi:lysine biosynthesis protein LysW
LTHRYIIVKIITVKFSIINNLQNMNPQCEVCKNDILADDFPDVTVGDVITCPHCGCELEVISVDPLEVQALEEK